MDGQCQLVKKPSDVDEVILNLEKEVDVNLATTQRRWMTVISVWREEWSMSIA